MKYGRIRPPGARPALLICLLICGTVLYASAPVRAQARRAALNARAVAARAVAARPNPGPPRLTLDQMIERAAGEAGISAHLLRAVVRQESSGNPRAVSPVGARGLTQLMPGTARRFGVRNIFDPMENLRGGAKYLRWLLDYFGGDVKLALAAYNSGEGTVDAYRSGRPRILPTGKVINPRGIRTSGIPPYNETINYVARIYPNFVRSAAGGRAPSSRTAPPGHPNSLPAPKRPGVVSGPGDPVAGERPDAEPKAGAQNTGASVYFWSPPRAVAPSVLPN